MELGIGKLPQKEITDALFAAGADEEVRFRRVIHRQVGRQLSFRDFAQTGQHPPLQGEAVLQAFALVLYGIYFVGFWSARGQTLAMQTWRIRVVDASGNDVSQWRALSRYVACCIAWFAPATLIAWWLGLSPWPTLGAVALGIVAYALLAMTAPGRQFWHDIACGTRLVVVPGPLRPRPR